MAATADVRGDERMLCCEPNSLTRHQRALFARRKSKVVGGSCATARGGKPCRWLVARRAALRSALLQLHLLLLLHPVVPRHRARVAARGGVQQRQRLVAQERRLPRAGVVRRSQRREFRRDVLLCNECHGRAVGGTLPEKRGSRISAKARGGSRENARVPARRNCHSAAGRESIGGTSRRNCPSAARTATSSWLPGRTHGPRWCTQLRPATGTACGCGNCGRTGAARAPGTRTGCQSCASSLRRRRLLSRPCLPLEAREETAFAARPGHD